MLRKAECGELHLHTSAFRILKRGSGPLLYDTIRYIPLTDVDKSPIPVKKVVIRLWNVIPCGTIRYNTGRSGGGLMSDKRLIVLTGDKGGVGKSTLAALLTEWLLSQGKQVNLIDADPNQT